MIIKISGFDVLIDDEDYDKVLKFMPWNRTHDYLSLKYGLYYFVAHDFNSDGSRSHRYVRLHRYLIDAESGGVVDHINRNTLDNRKCNLRWVSYSMNAFNSKGRINNTSGTKGVVWFKDRNKWEATIFHNGKRVHGGFFTDIEKAKARRLELEAECIYTEASIDRYNI